MSKKHTLKTNIDIIIQNIKENEAILINQFYADNLIQMLKYIKPKGNKSENIKKISGIKIKDTINNKSYISMREAERKTGIPINQIKDNIDHKIDTIKKEYKFESEK